MWSKAPKLFEWRDKSRELGDLFEKAGLHSLASEARALCADCTDIQTVLVELLLHRRIPYLPARPVPEMDLDELYTGCEISAEQSQALQTFVESLPSGVVFHRAARMGDGDLHQPYIVACVITETVFCQLEATFTLIPVPRPTDASMFLLKEH